MRKMINKVLIIGFVWPEPKSSAAGKRMMQLVSYFCERNCDITFASSAKKSSFSTDLENYGVKSASISVNESAFDDFVRELNPDLVLFDRFMTEEQFGWRVQSQCPNALRVLDTEDLHLLRYAREKSFKDGDDRIQRYLVTDTAKREIASIYRCDLSLIISETEMTLLRDFFKVPGEILHYISYMIDTAKELNTQDWPDYEKRHGFMTIGNFRHKPNLDSVNYLRTEIWPLIRKAIPEAVLNVYGAYPKQQVMDWHKPKQGFYIRGRAVDADEVMRQSKVCLSPLRFGAGLKGKFVEAMLNGTPSVTTSMGAEGINGSLDWPGAIADTPSKFAELAVEIYDNRTLWEEAQSRCRTIIETRFSKNDQQSSLDDRLEMIARELDHHRVHNFTGAMLMHHTMAGTKFMSRWIEEKNRKVTP